MVVSRKLALIRGVPVPRRRDFEVGILRHEELREIDAAAAARVIRRAVRNGDHRLERRVTAKEDVVGNTRTSKEASAAEPKHIPAAELVSNAEAGRKVAEVALAIVTRIRAGEEAVKFDLCLRWPLGPSGIRPSGAGMTTPL
jgi:hypothetical protein